VPWTRQAARWARQNAVNRTRVEGEWAPDRGDEYLFYQTLIGVWPIGEVDRDALVARVKEYMRKAIREAKLHTSWIHEHQGYERAVDDFVERTLRGPTAAAFLESFLPLQRRVAVAGAVNGLSQLLLKLAAPGVPDLYQGTELWDLTLVDPDNRRPVDYARRAAMLEALERALDPASEPPARAAAVDAAMASWEEGGVKLLLLAAGLRLRREREALFRDGDYVPLDVAGERAEHVIAFARRLGDAAAIAVAPRWSTRLPGEGFPLGAGPWSDTRVLLPADLAGRRFVDRITGAPRDVGGAGAALLPAAALFDRFPAALLQSA
jgi:(1->4)-alpha-D-glucan 1-alpha-D-glucosylmutase